MTASNVFDAMAARIGNGELNYSFNFSLKHNYLYVENAKCACSTIKLNLGKVEFADERLGDRIPEQFFKNVHVNVLGTPFVKPFQLGRARFDEFINSDNFIRFTFVRNPFTRILSSYLDKVQRNLPEAKQIRNALGKTDEESIEFVEFLRAVKLLKDSNRFLDKHWRPLSVQSPAALLRLTHIGRMESLTEDLSRILEVTGTSLATIERMDPHATHAADKLKDLYSDECVHLLLSLYERDFDMFGYQREVPA